MKIAWHMPTLRRTTCGLSIRALALAKRLCLEHGHEITFVVDGSKTDIDGDRVEGMPLRRFSVSRHRPLHWCLQAGARRRAAESLVKRIDSDHDVMISCQPEIVAAYAAKQNRRPVLYVCGGTTLLHDVSDRMRQASLSALRRLPFALDRCWKHRNESRAFIAADAVVFDSDQTRDLTTAAYGLNTDRLHAIHGGVDDTRFMPPDAIARRAARRRLGIADDGIVVVWTGRFSPEKNLGLLLRSLRHCRDMPDRVLLVGDGPTRHTLVKLAKELRLERVVQFTGEQADVRPFLHAADVFAFPSRGESFGGALAEAMSCELACVALRPDGRGIRNANCEIIEHGRCGLLVDRPDPEAFASALDAMVSEADDRRRLGQAARRRACERFTWAAGSRRLNKLVTALARSRLPIEDCGLPQVRTMGNVAHLLNPRTRECVTMVEGSAGVPPAATVEGSAGVPPAATVEGSAGVPPAATRHQQMGRIGHLTHPNYSVRPPPLEGAGHPAQVTETGAEKGFSAQRSS